MSTSDLVGRTLGQYQVVEAIGEGGMASVFRAVQPQLGRELALKILSNDLAWQPGFLERFENEARTLARLDHPYILPIYDFGTIGSVMFIATPLVRGGTLRDLLNGDALPLGTAWRYINMIGDALHHAHEAGVIHRDLKPSNILLHQDGRAFLADFGLCRGAATANGLTQHGFAVGTPGFMSPEQAMGQEVDRRADVYAFAVIAYEMLCGQRPFMAETGQELVMAHIYQPVPSAVAFNRALPAEVDVILGAALAKQPDQRTPSVAHFVQDLNAALMVTVQQAAQTPYPLPTLDAGRGLAPAATVPPPPGAPPPQPLPSTPAPSAVAYALPSAVAGLAPSAAAPVASAILSAVAVADGQPTPSGLITTSAVATLEHMGVRRLRSTGRPLQNSFFYHCFHAAMDVAGDQHWQHLLIAAGLTQYVHADPPSDGVPSVPSNHVALLQNGFETLYGAHAVEKLREWGRLASELEIASDRYHLSRLANPLGGQQKRVGHLLGTFCNGMDAVRGERLHEWRQIDPGRFWLVIYANPAAEGLVRSDRNCQFWVSVLESLLRWAGLANDWVVDELECGAVTRIGDCVFTVRSRKLV